MRRFRWTPRPWLPSSGLTTHGQPDALRRGERAVGGVDDLALRDRQAGGIEEPVGEVLVARDVDADAGRPRGHRGADPLLVDAVAELDERVAVEAQVRDVARGGLVEDRLGGRPERLALGEADEPLQLLDVVEGLVGVARGDEVVDEPDGERARLEPDGLLAELVDDVVLAGLPALRVLPWWTGVPARFWSSSAMCSATWPIHVPSLAG